MPMDKKNLKGLYQAFAPLTLIFDTCDNNRQIAAAIKSQNPNTKSGLLADCKSSIKCIIVLNVAKDSSRSLIKKFPEFHWLYFCFRFEQLTQ